MWAAHSAHQLLYLDFISRSNRKPNTSATQRNSRLLALSIALHIPNDFGSSPAADILFFAFIVAVWLRSKTCVIRCLSHNRTHQRHPYRLVRLVDISLDFVHAHRFYDDYYYYYGRRRVWHCCWAVAVVGCVLTKPTNSAQSEHESIHHFGVKFRDECSRRIIYSILQIIFDGCQHNLNRIQFHFGSLNPSACLS